MNMDWMPILVSAIGSIRLILIFTGILMLLRCIFKLHKFSEHQKQCFAVSGIVYLLGLMPQSLLLLVTNSEKATYSLDSGCLCWIQKFACIVSVSIHGILCLDCIFIILSSTHALNKLNALADHKKYFPILVVYVMLLATSRIFFLKGDDSNGFYMDVASKLDNASFIGWTMLPMQNTAQKVQLQLLLCESSLSARDMKYFLAVCYLLLFLPLIVMILILKVLLPKMQKSPVANQIFLLESAQGRLYVYCCFICCLLITPKFIVQYFCFNSRKK